jgi:hypothetical protein
MSTYLRLRLTSEKPACATNPLRYFENVFFYVADGDYSVQRCRHGQIHSSDELEIALTTILDSYCIVKNRASLSKRTGVPQV